MDVYRVENLTKIYPNSSVVANDALSFTIKQGEIFGLLGPNGAGKTTLLKQLLGLLPPTHGSIKLFGTEIVPDAAVVPYYVACMAQRPSALADLRVHEAMEITGHLRMMTRHGAKQQTRDLLEEFGLGALAKRVIAKLSGGQQRLVALCLALMAKLPVLILDEPTNDLDPEHRKKLWDKLIDINRTQGTTIILVTHNVLEAEKVLQRVGIISQGKIAALGSVSELKRRIDDRIRLDLHFTSEAVMKGVGCIVASTVEGEVIEFSENHYVLLSERSLSEQNIKAIITKIGLTALEDFRIISPTLEDVYLQLGGGERLESGTRAS